MSDASLSNDPQSTPELRRRDAAHHMHPFTDTGALNAEGARVIVGGDGVWITDSDGNRLLDGMSGLWCMQIGHGRREIADAVHRQMSELSYYNTFFKTTHKPAIDLAERLARLARRTSTTSSSPARARNPTTPSSTWSAPTGT